MTEELDHVLRPLLPWRDESLTECGLNPAGRAVITRDEALLKFRREGQKRAALTTCMTCLETARRWKSWDEDPVQGMTREVHRYPSQDLVRNELWALGELVRRHRDEFDLLLGELGKVDRLEERRQRKASS